jgi:phenylacetate-CoA ligase
MKTKIDLESLYSSFPIWLQNVAVNYEGWKLRKRRFNKKYFEVFNEILKRKKLKNSDLRDYQEQRLRKFLSVAYGCHYWKNRFQKFHIDLKNDNIFQELKKLPIITKQEVKKNIQGIINPNIPNSNLVKMHTSGTTGSGLIFYITKQAEIEWQATIWRHYYNHGINFNTWRGYFTGRSLVPLKQKNPPFWRKNIPGKRLMFDAYHLNKKTAKSYVNALRNNKISCLYGYPSFISLLAGYMQDQNIPPVETINVILTSSETLMPQQRSLIEKTFGIRVFQHYGLTELTAQFSECELGKIHVDEDFSFVEFIPKEKGIE